MKTRFSEELVKISEKARRYLKLEIEYIKLTTAEKTSVLFAGLAVGIIFLALSSFMLFLLALSCAELFKLMMCPALAYLCTAGIFLLLLLLALVFRNQWIVNPISRFITKVLFDKQPE